MSAQPEWAGVFVASLHPASIVLAVALPCIRASIRRLKGLRGFVMTLSIHDGFSGLALPSFVALAMSPMIPDVMRSIEGHNLQLAGLLGIFFTIGQVLAPGQDH